MNSPKDIYRYIIDSGRESDFLTCILLHKQNYSIAELPDAVFSQDEGQWRLQSKTYHLNMPVNDPEILAAAANGLYITVFLSRKEEQYQLHFLTHPYPAALKPRFEEDIAKEVVRYMILKTVVALRLDTPEKVDAYLGA